MGDVGPSKKGREDKIKNTGMFFFIIFIMYIYILKLFREETLFRMRVVYYRLPSQFSVNRWRKVKREGNKTGGETMEDAKRNRQVGLLLSYRRQRVNSYTRTCWSVFPRKCFIRCSDGSVNDRDNEKLVLGSNIWLIFLVIGISRQTEQPSAMHLQSDYYWLISFHFSSGIIHSGITHKLSLPSVVICSNKYFM